MPRKTSPVHSTEAVDPVATERGGIHPAFISQDGRFLLYQGNSLELLGKMAPASIDMIFADPPYFLSNNGITCQGGRMVSVNKGKWDRSLGFEGNYEFTKTWLQACKRLLKPHGTIWISGTSHIIHIVGCCLDELDYKVLNDITWVKTNPPPNLSCRYFTHATETILWAARDKASKHKFNYDIMKELNGGKQMLSVWRLDAPSRQEKVFGKHPTQKPLGLLARIVAASTDPNDVVLDPFSGSATTGLAATSLGRSYIGVEAEASYIELSLKRYHDEVISGELLEIRRLEQAKVGKVQSVSQPMDMQESLWTGREQSISGA